MPSLLLNVQGFEPSSDGNEELIMTSKGSEFVAARATFATAEGTPHVCQLGPE